jgi:hypothetical protein
VVSSSIVAVQDRYAPHPGLLAHFQAAPPVARRHPALGFQPR